MITQLIIIKRKSVWKESKKKKTRSKAHAGNVRILSGHETHQSGDRAQRLEKGCKRKRESKEKRFEKVRNHSRVHHVSNQFRVEKNKNLREKKDQERKRRERERERTFQATAKVQSS